MNQNKKAEDELKQRVGFSKLISSLAAYFINLTSDEIDSGINHALKTIGEFSGVDRSYIFLYREDGRLMDNTHEWCAPGIEPQIQRLKGLSVDDFPWIMAKHKRGELVHVPCVTDLPPEAEAEKKEFESEGIRSLVAISLVFGKHPIGFVGFDSVREEKTWDEDAVELLKVVGEMFSNALQRKRMGEALRSIAEGTASVTGRDFFPSLVLHLASALKVRYAFVAKFSDTKPTKVRTLAFWSGNDFSENVEFDLANSPCERVISEGEIGYYPDRIRDIFPDDEELVRLGAESYIGIPIRDSKNNIIGHLAVLDDKPMADEFLEISTLRIFAARAGAELERQSAEDTLKESFAQLSKKNRYETIVSAITRDIHKSINLQDVLENAVEAINKNVEQVDIIEIYFIEGEEAVLRAHVGYESNYVEQAGRIPFAKGFIWKTALEGRPIYCADVELDTIIGTAGREAGIKSYLSMPIRYREKVFGVIGINSFRKNAFDEEELKLLDVVAQQIETAINNAKQAEALQQALSEVKKLKNQLQAENVYLREEIRTEHDFEEIIGRSAVLQQVLNKVEQVAPTDANVLILGETGTGKELMARAIHNLSLRKERPLVKVNCGAISPGLVESELFGHEKGAFTGAIQRRVGRFELADGGTIFLDEVGELSQDIQVKLLRVIQEGEFERVGGSQTIKVDVRVIAATNRDLKKAVQEGDFRPDLYYRLNVFPLQIPPLRERKEDIQLLVEYFTARCAAKIGKKIETIPQNVMDTLLSYYWPGNIRELENVIERAVIVTQGSSLKIDDALDLRPAADAGEASSKKLEDVERSHILKTLEETNWVIHGQRGAASLLGMNSGTLRSRMKKLGIKRPQQDV